MDSIVTHHPRLPFYFLLHLSQGHRKWLPLSYVVQLWEAGVPEERLAGLLQDLGDC